MSVGRTGCTLVVLGQSSHEVALRAALEPPHGHRKYIYFDSPLTRMFIIWSIFGLVERIMKKTTSLGSESIPNVKNGYFRTRVLFSDDLL